MLNSQLPQTTWARVGALGVWVGVTLELSGCDMFVGSMLGNYMFSAMWWDGYSPLEVTTGSGCDCVASKVRTGVTACDEWHTCIIEGGIIYPFWKATTLAK